MSDMMWLAGAAGIWAGVGYAGLRAVLEHLRTGRASEAGRLAHVEALAALADRVRTLEEARAKDALRRAGHH